MDQIKDIKCLSKQELADKLNISVRWLAYHLNSVWFDELKTKIEYTKRQRILKPFQYSYILDKFVFIDSPD